MNIDKRPLVADNHQMISEIYGVNLVGRAPEEELRATARLNFISACNSDSGLQL